MAYLGLLRMVRHLAGLVCLDSQVIQEHRVILGIADQELVVTLVLVYRAILDTQVIQANRYKVKADSQATQAHLELVDTQALMVNQDLAVSAVGLVILELADSQDLVGLAYQVILDSLDLVYQGILATADIQDQALVVTAGTLVSMANLVFQALVDSQAHLELVDSLEYQDILVLA